MFFSPVAASFASPDVGQVAVSGQNASFSCSCPGGTCNSYLMLRWVRVFPNRSLETWDTFCEPKRCLSQTSSASTNLTLLRVGREDSALYYCGERQSTHLDFSAQGTFLQVLGEIVCFFVTNMLNVIKWIYLKINKSGKKKVENAYYLLLFCLCLCCISEEDEVWKTTCKVVLLTEWKSSVDMKERERRFPDLRCRVSGLRVPWADLVWRSTGKSPKILKTITWVLPENNIR